MKICKLQFLLFLLLLLGGCKDETEDVTGTGKLLLTVPKLDASLCYTLYAYPEGTDKVITTQLVSESTECVLPAGICSVALVGYDSESLELVDTEHFSSLGLGIKNAPDILLPLPHPAYRATAPSVRIEKDGNTSLPLTPEAFTPVLRLQVKLGKEFSGMEAEGTLGGIVAQRLIAGETDKTQETKKLKLPLRTVTDAGTYEVEAGLPGVGEEACTLTLSLRDKAGHTCSGSLDMTELLQTALAGGNDTLDISCKITPAVPIRLTTGIQTRAAIDAFDNTPVGIVYGTAPGNYDGYWEGRAAGGEITLTPERYYPSDGSALYLCGYYPFAEMKDGVIKYTLTGGEDLMLSSESVGSLRKPFDREDGGAPLSYKHLLTLLGFSLEIKNMPSFYKVRLVNMNGYISNVEVSPGKGGIVKASDPLPVKVYEAPAGGGIPVENGKVDLPGYLLVVPSANLTVDLHLAVNNDPDNDRVFKNVPLQLSGGEGGSAFEVVINLGYDPLPPTPTPDPVPDGVTLGIQVRVSDWETVIKDGDLALRPDKNNPDNI